MPNRPQRCLLLSDFNLQNLAGYLSNDSEEPAVQVEVAPYGQVTTALSDAAAEHWQPRPDAAVVWTTPEGVLPGFGSALESPDAESPGLMDAVDAFASLLKSAGDQVGTLLVASWTEHRGGRGLGMLEWRAGLGRANALAEANLRLARHCADSSNIFLFDAKRWIQEGGSEAFAPKLWYLAKIPFSNDVFKAAVPDIKAALRGVGGGARKLVVVDLDHTLWGGIVGETGWQQLRLGGHDGVGEAYADFQNELKALTRRGILIAIASKNEETVALEAIKSHPEMILKLDDFAGWRINWGDKAESIIELVGELNLGLQSVVFIDDSPAERGRVASALPEVLVPDWPTDPFLYATTLRNLSCFDSPSITAEDRDRSNLYASQRERSELKKNLPSAGDWLRQLGTHLTIEELNDANLTRAAQLLNKTNQMNLRTRRLSEQELVDWAGGEGHRLWTVRVKDAFGDSGLTGIVSLEIDEESANLTDFLLSCRVMGRGIEDALMHTLVSIARPLGPERLRAEYAETAKNKPCLDFFERAGMNRDAETVFSWDLSRPYPEPEHITVEYLEPLHA